MSDITAGSTASADARPASAHGARLLWLLALALAAAGALQLFGLMRLEPLGMDFLPLWVAGHFAWTDPGKIYDFAAVTAAQAFMLPPHFAWMRPYPEPPTTLLLAAPLARLPFWAANAIWSGASLAIFAGASLRLAGRNAWLAAVMAVALPAAVIGESGGQSVILASGLIALAVLELERRPRFAGVLLAMAALAEPQAALMAPVALVACGSIEALAAGTLVAALAIAASAILFGPARWSEWCASLPAMQQLVEAMPRVRTAIITPLWAARELGLEGGSAIAFATVFALAAGGLVWTVFRRSADAALRVGALAVGGLLATPYAICFEAALIAPAAMALAAVGIHRGRLIVPLLAVAAAYGATTPDLGFPSLLLFAGVVMATWRSSAAPGPAAGVQTQPAAALP